MRVGDRLKIFKKGTDTLIGSALLMAVEVETVRKYTFTFLKPDGETIVSNQDLIVELHCPDCPVDWRVEK